MNAEKVIVTKDPLYQQTPGQRVALSFSDKKLINIGYCSGISVLSILYLEHVHYSKCNTDNHSFLCLGTYLILKEIKTKKSFKQIFGKYTMAG